MNFLNCLLILLNFERETAFLWNYFLLFEISFLEIRLVERIGGRYGRCLDKIFALFRCDCLALPSTLKFYRC